MYSVIYQGSNGRLTVCDCKHPDAEGARKCADEQEGLSIIEWVRDRTPQFAEYWRHPDAQNPKLESLYKNVNPKD